MGIKETFTNDEWENLLRLPYAVSMTIIVAAPSALGLWGETKAMIEEPAIQAAASGSGLVGLILAEMQPKIKDLMGEQQNVWKQDQPGYKRKTIEACRSAAAALSKISPDEALAYKKWVQAIGMRVAEAAKEYGVFVSAPEQGALDEITSALGITA